MFTKFANKFVNKFTSKLVILVSVCLSSDTENTVLSRVVHAYKSKPWLGIGSSVRYTTKDTTTNNTDTTS